MHTGNYMLSSEVKSITFLGTKLSSRDDPYNHNLEHKINKSFKKKFKKIGTSASAQ